MKIRYADKGTAARTMKQYLEEVIAECGKANAQGNNVREKMLVQGGPHDLLVCEPATQSRAGGTDNKDWLETWEF